MKVESKVKPPARCGCKTFVQMLLAIVSGSFSHALFCPKNIWCENSGPHIKVLLALLIYSFIWLYWVFVSACELFIVACRI